MKNILPTDFQDDILNVSTGGKRKYRMVYNDDGTVSFDDVTPYDLEGSDYGAKQINETNEAVNECFDKNKIIRELSAINAVTQEGYVPDALALKDVTNSFTVLKNIGSQISFTQPTSGNVTVNSIRAWTKGNICGVSMSITNTSDWVSGGTIDIPISGFPKPIFVSWNIGLVIGGNFVGAYVTPSNNQIRLRNLGNSAIAPFENFNVAFTYTI